MVASDSASILEEGFSGKVSDGIDYDELVKELYGDDKPKKAKTDAEATQAVERRGRPAKRGPAPGLFKGSVLNGGNMVMSAASPFAVAPALQSWYSYVDASITIKLPYEIYVEAIPLYLLLEISSFSFENTYPEGGTFTGLAYILQASGIGENSGAVVGFGFWDGSMGSMLEMNYRFRPTTNTFLRFGTRGVLITEVDPIGAAWWLELRISTGIEL